jgi:uncharacterized protein YndB with AHSA1/START domain
VQNLPHILELARSFPTTADRLFSLWSTPDLLFQWSELEACDVDLRVGGEYRFAFPGEPPEDATTGKFTRIDRPRLLEFTWNGTSPSGPTGETLVTLEFQEMGARSELHLRHAFVHEFSMRECESGWEYWLNGLEEFLRRPNAG